MPVLADSATVATGTTGRIALPLLAGKRLLQIVLDIETSGAISSATLVTVRTRARTIVARHSPTRRTSTWIEYTLIADRDTELFAEIENNSGTNSRFHFSAVIIDDPAPAGAAPPIFEPVAGRMPVLRAGDPRRL